MSFSVNEIEALARKAARGAGMSWGLSEDVGQSVALLGRTDLPAVDLFADYLAWRDGRAHPDIAPRLDATTWRAPQGALCPFVTGAALADLGQTCLPVRLDKVAFPALLLPLAAQVGCETGACVGVQWDGITIWCAGDAVMAAGLAPDVFRAGMRDVSVSVGRMPQDVPAMCPRPRVEASEEAVQTLSDFAHRTYAPATEESRLSGAGAGLSDND